MRRAYPTRGCNSPGLPGEARFEPKSYGFQTGPRLPGRDRGPVQHAERQERETGVGAGRGPDPRFDRIDHNLLLQRIGTFPAREQVRALAESGRGRKGRFAPTEEGPLRAG